MSWKLKRTTQCAKCPWRTDVDPRDIPNGYDEAKHAALACTIAEPGSLGFIGREAEHVMACHETHEAHCVGWLVNQLGPGNAEVSRRDRDRQPDTDQPNNQP